MPSRPWKGPATPPPGAHSHSHSHPHSRHSPPLPPPQSSASHTLLLAFCITGGVTLLVVFILSLLILYYKLRSSRTSPFDPPANPVRLHKFSYRALKAATGSFSSENKLGQGGFGPVHKATLRNGQVVAVKSLDSSSLQGEKEFQNEVSVIGGVRSCHIVGLLGYCAQGRKRRLLVYEYMSRGSLQEALFHEENSVHLEWKMRHKIILQVAQALAFLHVKCEPPILHGDIKPSNVLLDENFTAKLADFGLARVKTEVNEEMAGESFAEQERMSRHGKETVPRKKSGKGGGGIAGQPEDMDMEDCKSTTTTRVNVDIKTADQTESNNRGEVAGGFSFHNDGLRLSSCPATPAPTPSMAGVTGNDSEAPRQLSPGAECDGRKKGREWWWPKPDEDSGTVVRDYTVDWVTCEVKHCQSKSRDWGERSLSSYGKRARIMHGVRDKESSVWAYVRKARMLTESVMERWKRRRKHDDQHHHQQQQQHQRENSYSGSLTKSREWWKEEYLEELSNKSRELKGERSKKHSRSRDMSCSFDFSGDPTSRTAQHAQQQQREWWSGDLLHWMHRSRGDSGTIDFSGELNSLSRELRNTTTNNRERTLSRERWSGELVASRAMSSTTSMRGTVCYTAPEYGGTGVLSEKSDVYSFGVLMLVVISGRRPLQVVSPREFERASLTSWARNLAHSGGDMLELVDSSLRGVFSREQALLCIMVALQCIQRVPAGRPSMVDVVRILSGEAQLPPFVPEMFSPSPSQQHSNQAGVETAG